MLLSACGTTITSTPTLTSTPTPTVTETPSPAPTITPTPTPAVTVTPTSTPTLTVSVTPIPTPVITPPPTSPGYTLTVIITPPGTGSVSPSGGQYAAGTEVTLTPTAAPGYAFYKWSGNVGSESTTLTFTMNSSKTISAIFLPVTPVPPPPLGPLYTLRISINPPGSGTVDPPGGLYTDGASVTLTATPAKGFIFDNWSGVTAYSPISSLTSPTPTLIMRGSANIVANFVPEAAP